MADETILLADDDEMIVDALSFQLKKEGYTVCIAIDGEEALHMARSQQFDLILLDVMMPKKQGWEVCQEIRRESAVPILMLTARGEEMDRVLGLELGADDYIVKPFSFRELLARIHANLRRSAWSQSQPNPTDEQLVCIGPLEIDKRRYTVAKNGEPVSLSQREYQLLITLQEAESAVVKRGDLLDRAWGEEWFGDPRTLDVHIRWLREKLEIEPSNPQLILTVRGVGYRMIGKDEA